MGKLFLHGRSRKKENTDTYAKLVVKCPVGVTVRAASVHNSTAIDVVSVNGVAVFDRLSEGEWDITFIGTEYPPVKRIKIDSLDNEIVVEYFDATINVSYPVGSICTCSDGKTILTAPDTSGNCTFTIVNPGNWTIESIRDDLYDSEIVSLTTNGQSANISLKYFEATIDITYPSGSTCTLTNGSKTYTAPDTSGSWSSIVNYSGTWTASCSNGERTETSSVEISSDGQNASITLDYFEATINITYTSGATCTCSRGDETYTAPDTSGSWSCVVPSAGTWTITVKDSTRSETGSAVVSQDGQTVSVTVKLFEAYINVTYPSGSTCTCTDGTTTLKAPNTTGTWKCTVPNTGTWTVKSTSGSNSASQSVSITASGQSKTATLSYTEYLYKSGEVYSSVTGGWTNSDYKHSGSTLQAATLDSTQMTFTGVSGYYVGRGTKNIIDMSNKNLLTIKGKLTSIDTSNSRGFIIVVASAKDSLSYPSARLYVNTVETFTKTIDVSKIESGYVCIYIYGSPYINGTITEVSLT